MIRELYLAVFSNYVCLIAEGALYRYKRQVVAGIIAYLVLITVSLATGQFMAYMVLDAVFKIFLAYFTILAITMLYWRHRTKNLGLNSLLIYPGSSLWLNKLLTRENIKVPIHNNAIELHVGVRRKYKDWGDYNNALEQDINKLTNHLKSGQFGKNVTIIFNSFNSRIIDKLEKALTEHGHCMRFKQVALSNMAVSVYHPAHFRKVQMKMFGEVKSTRAVHVPEAWELLVYNHTMKGGKAV